MRLLWALFVAASLTPAGIAGESFSGKVVAISDGDTIRVMHHLVNIPRLNRIAQH